MPDIGDFIRRSRRSTKIAIPAPGTPGDFRRSRRFARCVAGLIIILLSKACENSALAFARKLHVNKFERTSSATHVQCKARAMVLRCEDFWKQLVIGSTLFSSP